MDDLFVFFHRKKIVSEMRGRDKNLGMGNEPARTLHAILQRRCLHGLISFKLVLQWLDIIQTRLQ